MIYSAPFVIQIHLSPPIGGVKHQFVIPPAKSTPSKTWPQKYKHDAADKGQQYSSINYGNFV